MANNTALSSLIVDVRPGEALRLHDLVRIELVQKSGRVARLRIIAPREIRVQKESAGDANHVPSMADCV